MPLKCEIQKYPLLILLLIYFLIPILNINCGTEKKGPEIPGGDPDKNFVKLADGFEQEKWIIQYSQMQQINKQWMPRKLKALQNKTRLKLVIDSWTL